MNGQSIVCNSCGRTIGSFYPADGSTIWDTLNDHIACSECENKK